MIADTANQFSSLRAHKRHEAETTVLLFRVIHFENGVFDLSKLRKVILDVVDGA
jgi:hypothetical protein